MTTDRTNTSYDGVYLRQTIQDELVTNTFLERTYKQNKTRIKGNTWLSKYFMFYIIFT